MGYGSTAGVPRPRGSRGPLGRRAWSPAESPEARALGLCTEQAGPAHRVPQRAEPAAPRPACTRGSPGLVRKRARPSPGPARHHGPHARPKPPTCSGGAAAAGPARGGRGASAATWAPLAGGEAWRAAGSERAPGDGGAPPAGQAPPCAPRPQSPEPPAGRSAPRRGGSAALRSTHLPQPRPRGPRRPSAGIIGPIRLPLPTLAGEHLAGPDQLCVTAMHTNKRTHFSQGMWRARARVS